MTYDEWSKITKMVCKRCGKTLLRWEKIWGAEGGVICDKCNNEIINENWSDDKGFEDKITEIQKLIAYAVILFDFASTDEVSKKQLTSFLNSPNPINMFVLTTGLFLDMAIGTIIEKQKFANQKDKLAPPRDYVKRAFKRIEKISKDLEREKQWSKE